MTNSLRSKAISSARSALRGGAPADEDLAHDRLARTSGVAQGAVVGGHGAPAEHALALGADDLLEARLTCGAAVRIRRQEDHADAIGARRRQLEA